MQKPDALKALPDVPIRVRVVTGPTPTDEQVTEFLRKWLADAESWAADRERAAQEAA